MRYRCWMLDTVGLVAALGCVFLSGCSKSAFNVVPVSGKVTLAGKGVPKLNIVFQPLRTSTQEKETGAGSSAQTNDEGAFELTLADGSQKKGALVGKHEVRFSRVGPAPEPGSDVLVKLPPDPDLDPVLANLRKRPKQIEVPAGGTKDLNIELK